MTRRRRSRKRGRSGLGRFLEGMAALVLVLVILTFGISIASRYQGPTPSSEQLAPSPEMEEGEMSAPELRISGPPRELKPLRLDRPQIEIANGCGIPGLAAELRFELQGPEFDVVDTGNADHYDYAQTLVVASEADRAAAESVAQFLQSRYGVGKLRLQPERPSGLAEVRVVIGTDLSEATRSGSNPAGR